MWGSAVLPLVCALTPSIVRADASPGVLDEPGLRVEVRERDDGVRELIARGVIEAPPEEVFVVLCDARRARDLVPHLAQLQILAEDRGGALAYQRLEVPTLAPRDFTIRHACHEETLKDGGVRRINEWRTDNAAGPPQRSGVVRLELNEGSWVLDELDGGRRTLAVYRIRINPGGEVPRFLLTAALQLQVPALFQNIARATRR